MSLLIVGLSHRSAPVPLLERTAYTRADVVAGLGRLLAGEHVQEAVLLSTCNRIEIIAEVDRFHGALNDLSAELADRSGLTVAEIGEHLFVHYEDAAVAHLFAVATGLDSMVVGESQVLGQLRAAYSLASEHATVGRTLHELCQQALRVGKRVHTQTGIDRVGASVVGIALDEAARVLGGGLAARRAVVVGAGSMGALTGATLRRRGLTDIVIANRSTGNATRLAASLAARAVDLTALEAELVAADLVVTSTGASGQVISADVVTRVVAARAGAPLVILDLALPHDVDPAVAALPGVTYVDLEFLRAALEGSASELDIAAAQEIVDFEVAAHVSFQRAAAVGPTVAALRGRAAKVVEAELTRLDSRLPGLSPAQRAEFAQTARRVVDKLLHEPTVRVTALAGEPGGEAAAMLLRELFGLDPERRDLSDAVALPVESGS